MNTKYKSLEEKIFILNPDEKFYKDYYQAGRSLQGLKTFFVRQSPPPVKRVARRTAISL